MSELTEQSAKALKTLERLEGLGFCILPYKDEPLFWTKGVINNLLEDLAEDVEGNRREIDFGDESYVKLLNRYKELQKQILDCYNDRRDDYIEILGEHR